MSPTDESDIRNAALEERWQTMDTAPKTGERILIKTVTFGWSSDICQHVATGDKWVEARWGKDDLSGRETWLEWCGNAKTHTTDSLTPLAWAPLPKPPEPVAAPKPFTFADPAAQREHERHRAESEGRERE